MVVDNDGNIMMYWQRMLQDDGKILQQRRTCHFVSCLCPGDDTHILYLFLLDNPTARAFSQGKLLLPIFDSAFQHMVANHFRVLTKYVCNVMNYQLVLEIPQQLPEG